MAYHKALLRVVLVAMAIAFAVFASAPTEARAFYAGTQDINIMSPSSGQAVSANSTAQIQWNAGSAPPTAGHFEVHYSLNGGVDWTKIQDVAISVNQVSWQAEWPVPNATGNVRLFVGCDSGGRWERHGLSEISI